ncbi:MAG: hypothetical protein Q9164_001576 [Protoblastenia rupestris]
MDQAAPETSHGWSSMSYDTRCSFTTPRLESPPSLANTQYKLAGGLDTPTARATSYFEPREQCDSKQRMHGARGSRDWDPMESDVSLPQTPLALAHERNGQPRIAKSPNIRDGLGNVIYRFAGIAGKVLENWTTAFRGFYAGGGQGYEINPTAQTGFGTAWPVTGQDTFGSREESGIPPTPGGFPPEDFIPDYMSQDHSTPHRATKRNKINSATDDSTAKWVMVGSTTSSRETSPARLSQRKVPASCGATRRTASKFTRRPILPASRPSLSSFAGSPGLRSDCASFASPRSAEIASPIRESPVSVEVQRHAARLRKKEAEEDANLKRFNKQLKVMIREGKEALGTKFEVEEIEVDEETVNGGDVFGRGVG